MGVVYVLTNEAMPGFVKIGHTGQAIEARMRSLNGTGMPYPFECVAAWEFRDAPGVEATHHRAFADRRVSRSREFFKMDPDKVVALLERFGRRNVTPSAKKVGKRRKATDEPKPRRGNFKFSMIAGIEPGVVLTSVWDENVTCRVVDDRRVEFGDEAMTLSAAAKRVLHGMGRNWASVAGPDSWCYGDPPRTLNRLREDARS